ncbi:MAG: hypothetical protein PF692_14865 [Kiritimatiellae bacterium]|jgi:hypothetical protein|nr:hypothetical protein [Kiritimatiellia bacterium]
MNTNKLHENTIFDYTFIVILFLAIPVILLVLIRPLNQKFFKLSSQNKKLENELIEIRSNYSNPLILEKARTENINNKLKENWKNVKETIKLLNTLSDDDTFRTINEDAIIDYKISLFNTDLMLREEASSYKMILPDSIGLPEEVEDNQNIEILFDQLSVISKLTRLTMKSGVQAINNIECYPPNNYMLIEEENAIVTEYPIKINIVVSYKALINLLENFNKQSTFFAVSQIEILKADKFNKDVLYVHLVCASFGFNERLEEDGFIDLESVEKYLKAKEKDATEPSINSRRTRVRGREQ